MQGTQDSVKTCPNTECPNYGQTASKYRDESGIEVDRCSTCRTDILDAGELRAIIEFAVNRTRAHAGGHQMPVYARPVHTTSHRGYGRSHTSSPSGLFGGSWF